MKEILLLTVLSLAVCFNIHSQDQKQDKQAKKDAEKARYESNLVVIDSLLASRRFIIMADYASDLKHPRVSIDAALNYIKIDSSSGIFQRGGSYVDIYGFSVLSFDGTVEQFSSGRDRKRQNCMVNCDIRMKMDYLKLSMTISGDFRAIVRFVSVPTGLTLYGRLLPLDNANYIKGVKF
jgi:hypothetical protein